MQVRHLSPISFWIELPLTSQAPQLMWGAMNECGLVRGKINSMSTTHFVPDPSMHQYTIQGLTPLGLFADNVLIQVHLHSMDEGTRVELDAANARDNFDFGTSSRLQQKYASHLESFFRLAPTDWEKQLETETHLKAAPIASPTGQEAVRKRDLPEFGTIAPFDHEAPFKQLRWVLFASGTFLLTQTDILILALPVLLLWCYWMLWQWRHLGKVLW